MSSKSQEDEESISLEEHDSPEGHFCNIPQNAPKVNLPMYLRKMIRDLYVANENLKEKLEYKEGQILSIQESHEEILQLEINKRLRKEAIHKRDMEKLPWEKGIIARIFESFSSSRQDKHVATFEKILKGFAFCVNMEEEKWIWYNWSQRLWAKTSSRGMIPLLYKTVSGIAERAESIDLKPKFSKKLYKDTYLLDIISFLRAPLADTNGVELKLNTAANIIPVKDGKVFDFTEAKLRDRTRLDYLSYYWSNHKIFPVNLESLALQKESLPQENIVDVFFSSNNITITKNATDKVPTAPLHREFCKWCEEKNYASVNARRFTEIMKNKDIEKKRYQDGFYWIGVKSKILLG